MPVLTIYNHGTGGASSKPASGREIVNLFGNNDGGVAGRDFIITEGVGEAGSPHLQLRVQTDQSGPARNIQVAPSNTRVRETLQSVAGTVVGRAVAAFAPEDIVMQASGIGADENVASVVNMVTRLVRKGAAPTAINMMGWSRGGVTCIRIAHFLNLVPELARIPVNIFAVDPVAGAGHDDEVDAQTLGANVKNYVATLAMHENRSTFSPMEFNRLKFGTGTRVAVLPMPGHHSDTAKRVSSSGMLTFHLCATFLEHHGTQLKSVVKSHFKMANDAVLQEYDKLMRGDDSSGVHWQGQSWDKLATAQGGDPRGHARDVVAGHNLGRSFFINAHHLAVFASKYPLHYNAISMGRPGLQAMGGALPGLPTLSQLAAASTSPMGTARAGGLGGPLPSLPAHTQRFASLPPGPPFSSIYLNALVIDAVQKNNLA